MLLEKSRKIARDTFKRGALNARLGLLRRMQSNGVEPGNIVLSAP